MPCIPIPDSDASVMPDAEGWRVLRRLQHVSDREGVSLVAQQQHGSFGPLGNSSAKPLAHETV
jgi:hypothetical protein